MPTLAWGVWPGLCHRRVGAAGWPGTARCSPDTARKPFVSLGAKQATPETAARKKGKKRLMLLRLRISARQEPALLKKQTLLQESFRLSHNSGFLPMDKPRPKNKSKLRYALLRFFNFQATSLCPP